MPQGKVKWFDIKKGYGFIKPTEGQGDVFVHLVDVYKSGLQSLKQGQEVEYHIYASPRKQHEGKQHAKDIKILTPEPPADE